MDVRLQGAKKEEEAQQPEERAAAGEDTNMEDAADAGEHEEVEGWVELTSWRRPAACSNLWCMRSLHTGRGSMQAA